jgi:hypothetical protein
MSCNLAAAMSRPGRSGGDVTRFAGCTSHPAAKFRDREHRAKSGDQRRCLKLGIVTAAMAPAEYLQPLGGKIAERGRAGWIVAVRQPPLECTHRAASGIATKPKLAGHAIKCS